MFEKIKSKALIVLLVLCFGSMGFNMFNGNDRSGKLKVSFWGTNIPYYNAMTEIVETYNEKYKKDFEVILSKEDAGNYRTWMSAQLSGGNASDILMTTPVYADTDASTGKLIDLTKYLNQVNPYNDTPELWRDTFAGSYLTQVQDTNQVGRYNCIPTSTVSVRVVVNKEMLEERDIAIPDENWTFSDYRRICEAFEEEGMIGMQVANMEQIDYMVSWMSDIFLAQVMYDEILTWDTNGNDMIDAQEIARTFLSDDVKFDITKSNAYKSVMQFMKKWSAYWGDGFTSLKTSTVSENFLRQQVPMMLSGSWGVAGIELTLSNQNAEADPTNPYTKFDYVSLPFPRLEENVYLSQSESYTFTGLKANLPLQELGEPSDCYCIPASVQKNGKLDAAVDFLQFLSSREAAEILANTSFSIPVLTNVQVNPIMQDYLAPTNSESIRMRFGLQKLADGTAQEFHFKRMQTYLSPDGKTSLTKLCKDVQERYLEVTDLLAKDNEWTF